MRIIGGILGGRRIDPPAKMPHTRPTTDRAREALFNILSNRIDFESTIALDLFAGTGCNGFELYSRGAKRVVSIEKDATMHAFIQKTSASLGLTGCQAIRMDAFQFLESCTEQFDIILADPPYQHPKMVVLPEAVMQQKVLKPGGYLVVEHTNNIRFHKHKELVLERVYGDTCFSFFSSTAEAT